VIRADIIRHSANRGKADRILAFARRYRACAAAIAAAEWRTFFTTGKLVRVPADVDAAKIVARRRSFGVDFRFATNGKSSTR
jgi:hypothetical protein